MLTHGNISRVIVFLAGLCRGKIGSLAEIQMIANAPLADRVALEQLSLLCKLTRVSASGQYELSDDGRVIAEEYIRHPDQKKAFRFVLRAYVREARPGWAYKIPAGREEVFSAMDADELFCFKEAGLTGSPVTDAVVRWWDECAAFFRSSNDNDLLLIGRDGERATIRYELHRTGCCPSWVSVDSNFAGYDILSRQERGGTDRRLIEVKATKQDISNAVFYVTQHEWETAEVALSYYYFYLWKIGSREELAIIDASEMFPHIARNQGSGRWTSIAIPFSEFSSSFHAIV